MFAQQINNKVSIQQAGLVQDALGQMIPGWPELAAVWADIRYLSGLEAVRADAPVSVAKVSIRIRKRTDVTAGMRVVDADGAVYNIQTVLPNKQNRQYVDLACEQGANLG
ncbi:phage head closure protein [Variovorax sp. RT4R15]|uniref:phage head closure protein n=1 Tax=Variovorax sp. RT4R15 TaxID=3443737 RepID=UPI003F489EC4